MRTREMFAGAVWVDSVSNVHEESYPWPEPPPRVGRVEWALKRLQEMGYAFLMHMEEDQYYTVEAYSQVGRWNWAVIPYSVAARSKHLGEALLTILRWVDLCRTPGAVPLLSREKVVHDGRC